MLPIVSLSNRVDSGARGERDLRHELEELREKAANERAAYELRLAQAVAERDRALATLDRKSTALACLSHELRTPMNGILGMTRVVLDSELSQQQRECLELAADSADRLLTLVNDVLDLSKLGAGRLALEAIPFSVRDVVSTSVRSLTTLATQKGLEVETVVADDIPQTLLGDPTRLRQVLLNLLSNAIKFTDRGRVALSAEAGSRTGDSLEVLFRVADQGIGIPEGRIDSLFEPYSQVASSTSRRYGGTGLGLAICRDLVDLMEGRIWVESTEGEGSDFFFTARCGVAPAPRDREKSTTHGPAAAVAYVLAVEPAAAEVARQVEQVCQGASLFDSPEAFLEAVAARAPDLAFIDLDHFPLDMVAKLGGGVRIITLASAGQRGDAARCRAAGAAVYLTRPLGPLDLRDAARAALGWDGGAPITRHWLRERRSRCRILAADDSAANRSVLQMMLEAEGYSVVTAVDGQDAVEVWKREAIDLILMDLDMPVLNGIEATQALRQAGARVPIVALTGHLASDRIESCLAAGMTGHLGKPLRIDQLIGAVDEALQAAG